MRELGLSDLDAYAARLESDPGEWSRLDALCRIPISRFYRDRIVMDRLRDRELPRLIALARSRGDTTFRAWSLGCASGEEAYTLALIWRLTPALGATPPFDILATDASEPMLQRARRGSYGPSSLKDLPSSWVRQGFRIDGETFTIRNEFREPITWRVEDVRTTMPQGPFHLILCRNLVFTYFDESLQRELLPRLTDRLVPGGALILGSHEKLPEAAPG
jgi:chemotaxis protein methyltransferase CheR